MNQARIRSLILLVVLVLVTGCGRETAMPDVHSEGGVHGPDGVHGETAVQAVSGSIPGAASRDEPEILIEPSGILVSQTYDVADFDEIEATFFEVQVLQSQSRSVAVEVDQNVLEHIRVTVENGCLVLDLMPDSSYQISNVVMRADVTAPTLKRLSLAMSGNSTISGFVNTEGVALTLGLSSSLSGDLEADTTVIDAGLTSVLSLTGGSRRATVRASGGSRVDLEKFAVVDAQVDAGGNSVVVVNATGNLNAQASMGSQIYYLGNPALGEILTTVDGLVEAR